MGVFFPDAFAFALSFASLLFQGGFLPFFPFLLVVFCIVAINMFLIVWLYNVNPSANLSNVLLFRHALQYCSVVSITSSFAILFRTFNSVHYAVYIYTHNFCKYFLYNTLVFCKYSFTTTITSMTVTNEFHYFFIELSDLLIYYPF